MSYIGNTNTTQAFTPAVDFFSGNASTTAFTLSRPVASVAQVEVYVSNVPQTPGTAYTVSSNTITFTSAPPSGTNNIYVYYTSPITQVIAPGQGTVGTTQLQNGLTVNFADGSAAAPSITNDGDTNTGIFFPAADTIAFSEGGVEAMRIDSSGNVGIGTTTPNAKLEVAGAISTGTTNNFVRVNQAYLSSGGDYVMLANNAWFNGSAWTTPANGGLYQITGQSHFWYTQTSGAFTSVASITPAGLFQFNSGYGSVATAYGCRAWVNFNGTGTVAIRASGNVSSITDNGTGLYTVNFTTAMPDVNYAAVGTCNFEVDVGIPFNTRTLATGSAGVETYRPYPYNTPVDVSTVSFAVFR